MIAKQTTLSASLLTLLVASADPARAEPGAEPERPDEAPFDDPVPAPSGATGRFQVGVGYRSDEGFSASAQVAQDNLFGTGTRLALDASLSARRQRFVIGFEEPTLFGTNFALSTNIYTERREMFGFTREAVGSSLMLSHSLGRHVRGFASYRFERIDVTPDMVSSARGTQASDPFRGGRLGALRVGLEYNTLDSQFMPTRGTRVGTSVEIADRNLGSEIDMFRTDAWMSHHRPLGPFTLHLAGTVSSVSGNTPFSERLHFEGARDVRGYALGALGPIDHNGMSLGGNFKYTARGELEVPLSSRAGISAAGWVDAGSILVPGAAWSAASVGFGLIWRSPIGPLRFDWALPLDGSSPAFVFGLGGTW